MSDPLHNEKHAHRSGWWPPLSDEALRSFDDSAWEPGNFAIRISDCGNSSVETRDYCAEYERHVSKKDQIRIGAEIGSNTRLVERRKDGRVGTGTLTVLKNGQSFLGAGEIVRVRPGEDGEWHDVETMYEPESEPEGTLSGPAQVATPKYRAGYDRIFGKKPSVGLA